MNEEKKELLLKKLRKSQENLQDKLEEIELYVEVLEEQTNLSQFEKKEAELKAKGAEIQEDVKQEPTNIITPQILYDEQAGPLP